MQKRDPKKREYIPYKIPDSWNTPLMTGSMNEFINCASCWSLKMFWACFTSRHIHNDIGLGYPVCTECYNKEFDDINATAQND